MSCDISLFKNCTLCPRSCRADRASGETGFCGETASLRAARAAIHLWEEPCISGVHGSGAVFFSGCNLRCVFCQNASIAGSRIGKDISVSRLAEIFLTLQEQKANNINLVTPTHFVPLLIPALELAKKQGLSIPIVYNTSAYEKIETLRMLDGLIDVYLPDLKYYSSDLSSRYSSAPDYFETAAKAIAEMYRQVGAPVFAPEKDVPPENGPDRDISETMLMKRGMIVRHLLLPGCEADSLYILRYLFRTYRNEIYLSLMNQYTPMPGVEQIPALNRRVDQGAYDALIDACIELGMEQVFIQEGDTARESFIPLFDYEGL